MDHAGNLVILDTDNNRVRVVAARSGRFYGQAMTARHIYTVAGDGTFTFSGDGGPATKAGLSFPEGVAVDPGGNLVIADTDAHRVRVVATRSGRFYGQAMTAGNIYTVAGNGSSGDTGDGGPALDAELGFLQAVTVDSAGNLVLSDAVNGVIRVVAAKSGTFYGQAMTAGHIYIAAGNTVPGSSGNRGLTAMPCSTCRTAGRPRAPSRRTAGMTSCRRATRSGSSAGSPAPISAGR